MSDKLNTLVTDMWLAYDEYAVDNSDRFLESDKVISATAFLRSPRNIIGNIRKAQGTLNENQQPNEVKFNPVYSKIGTAVHNTIDSIIKNHSKEALEALGYDEDFISSIKILSEERFTSDKTFNGWTITGKVDYVLNGTLHDIKTVSSYVYDSNIKEDDYKVQASIYKYISDGAIKGDNFFIDYIIRDGMSKKADSNIQISQYDFLSTEEVEKLIEDKTTELNKYWDEEDLTNIPCCDVNDEIITTYKFFTTKQAYLDGKRAFRTFETLEEAKAFVEERKSSGKSTGYIAQDNKVKEGFRCPFCDISPLPEKKDFDTEI